MLGVGCFCVILLEYFLSWMEIGLTYLLVSFLSLVCIGVCNCTSVIVEAFFVTWGVLCEFASG